MSEREKELELRIAELESECRELRERARLLDANSDRAGGFENKDETTAQAFADQAALAVTNDRLFGQFSQTKETAAVVAKFMVLGDREMTLDSIVKGTQQVLRSDAVVLFTYDEGSLSFHHPPTMIGVQYPDRVDVSEERLTGSIVHMMLGIDKPCVINNVADDPLFSGKRFAIDEQIKSCVAIPLKAGAQRVGVMFVNYRTLHTITSNDLGNLELFANYAVVAIHYTQLFNEQEARLKAQNSLVALTQTVLENLGRGNLEGIMETVVAAAATVLGTEFCSIVEQDDNNRLVVRAAHGWPKSMVGDFTLGRGLGTQTGYTIESKAPARVYDYTTESRFTVPDIVAEYNIRSGISAPIIKGDKIVGAMLAHTKRLRRFTGSDERLLSMVANFLATAISSARYEEIEPHYENLKSVLEASKAITTLTVAAERKTILDIILKHAVSCINRRRNRRVVLGTIQLYDEHTQQLLFESIYPEESSSGYIKIGMGWRVSEEIAGKELGVTGRGLLRKNPQLVDNVDDLRGESGDYREYSRETRSELAMPMIDVEGRCIGVLGVESDEVGSFDEYDQEMLRLLAELAVIGIQSLKTRTELMASNAITWMGMTGSHWRHAILNDAMLIKDYVTEIRGLLGPAAPKKIEAGLSIIDGRASRILDGYDTTELSPENASPQPVNALLRDRITQSKDYDPAAYKSVDVRFRLKLPEDAQVNVDPAWFFRTLDILLDNANRAMRNSPSKTLTIATRQQDSFAVIETTDTGKGVPPDVIPKLFLEPIKDNDVDGCLGVGLLMAQQIVSAYGGRVKLVNTGQDGTAFAIYLPLAQQ